MVGFPIDFWGADFWADFQISTRFPGADFQISRFPIDFWGSGSGSALGGSGPLELGFVRIFGFLTTPQSGFRDFHDSGRFFTWFSN